MSITVRCFKKERTKTKIFHYKKKFSCLKKVNLVGKINAVHDRFEIKRT